MSNDDLVDDMFDHGGWLAQWIEREKQIYLAHAGRDGTLEGFREHVCKLMEADPEKQRKAFESFVDAFIANDPDLANE
jgi:hypothetical protein